MIYVLRQRSEGANHLVNGLNATRPGVAQRVVEHYGRCATPRDLVISWGTVLPTLPAEWRVLNRTILGDKLSELARMHTQGIPVPPFQRTPGSHGEWLPRTIGHGNGGDFKRYLAGERNFGDYYTQRVPIAREHRIHCFGGRVIKRNTKYPATADAHPWIRCEWGLGAPSRIPPVLDTTALAAVVAVGYDFGAVDIGESPHGDPIVLEVNSAPWLGLTEPNVPGVSAYVRAVLQHYDTLGG